MIDLERAKRNFRNHVATFTDYGNIKMLDFKRPDSNEYRIRFLFEEDYCRLHISGDLGALIATNFTNMTYEKFSDFVDNTGYFATKIDCMSRSLYYWNQDKAESDLRELLEENGYDDVENTIDEILWDFDCDSGLNSDGRDELEELITDSFEYAESIGKEKTGILELYMLAFKLAVKQLEDGGDEYAKL